MPSIFARPNKFNLSHTNSLTCDMGALVPFLVQEVLPGDEFRIKTESIVRLAPMLAPVFGEIDLYTHYFFVPNRLLWSNWEKFITRGLESGSDSSVPPYFRLVASNSVTTYASPGSLLDYLGYPAGDSAGSQGSSFCTVQGTRFSSLPLRAYNLVYNEWYRPEFVKDPIPFSTDDGSETFGTTNNAVLQYRCWPRDYFTSSNPFVQLGTPVTIGIGSSAPVVGDGKALGLQGVDGDSETVHSGLVGQAGDGLGSHVNGYNTDVGTQTSGNAPFVIDKSVGVTTEKGKSGLVADLSAASAITINDLRTAFQLQRILERKARSGNRYVEYLASTFGVRSPDARLQRPEFLGGGKSSVLISEVLQTSSGTEASPQGNMAGHGFGASRTFAVNKAFTEHGYILGILSVMPKTSFFQGRKREHCRWSWTDYAQPEFYHLGEQPVYKSELLCHSNAGDDSFDMGDIFGYQPRYEEYRRKLSEIHGDFRTSMSYWHLARVFSYVPSLNEDFMACNPSKRIFAAGDQAVRPCWIHMFLDIRAIRPLSKKGNPGMIDH